MPQPQPRSLGTSQEPLEIHQERGSAGKTCSRSVPMSHHQNYPGTWPLGILSCALTHASNSHISSIFSIILNGLELLTLTLLPLWMLQIPRGDVLRSHSLCLAPRPQVLPCLSHFSTSTATAQVLCAVFTPFPLTDSSGPVTSFKLHFYAVHK